jgi:hypothetical protein
LKKRPKPLGRVVAIVAMTALGGSLLGTRAVAQEGVSAATRPPRGSARMIDVPQTLSAPTIDGVLDDEAWSAAAPANDFWISLENRRPSERTEVLLMADAKHLYFAFRVFDSDPDGIVALQTRRDVGLALDDRVTVELDPFRSFNAAATSKFSVNARGTQHDEIGSGRARQLSWKGDWKAAAARTDYGWAAEIAIPFAILNFEPGAETFSANFYRYHNRTRELAQWADTTPQDFPEEIGRITALVLPVKAKQRAWTFLPYLFTGHNVQSQSGKLHSKKVNAGFDVRYQPKPNLTALVTVNPDLSQIEKAVTDINFSYNEKSISDYRPFFQEGSAYYGGDESYYFYSNRIPDLEYGMRAFGRLGKTQFGTFITSSPDGRFDYFSEAEYQIDKTHKVGAVVVGSNRKELNNTLYAVRGAGREASGLNYAFEGAISRTRGAEGDGRFTQGEVGWKNDYWSTKLIIDEYTKDFLPANGLVDRDLLDTRGGTAAAGYYRDFGSGPLYNIQGNIYWQRRYTIDDDLQKSYVGVTGSVELRREIRMSLGYTGGKYRATGRAPGSWETSLNSDGYWTGGLDFNTRNDRFSYGFSFADGKVADADYRYVTGYMMTRPTAVTYLKVSAEQLSLFEKYNQIVVTGGWDITPRQNISARLIHAYYGDSVRVSWNSRLRKNLDLFVVSESMESGPITASLKLIMTLP